MPSAEDARNLVAPVIVVSSYTAYFAVGVILSWIDIRTHRLPNRIVVPAAAVALLCGGAHSLLGEDGDQFLRIVVGGTALFLLYLALSLASGGGIGGGDVKLAGLIGMMLGWSSWESLLAATLVTFLLGGIAAGITLIVRRGEKRTRIAFGPWMVVGSWIAILWDLRSSGALGF